MRPHESGPRPDDRTGVMMKLVVVCCVGLTPAHLGADTPHLTALADAGFAAPMRGVVPAVTTTRKRR